MRNEGEPSRSLWVGNVSPEASEHELQDIFQQFGPVDAVKVLPLSPTPLRSIPPLCLTPKAPGCSASRR